MPSGVPNVVRSWRTKSFVARSNKIVKEYNKKIKEAKKFTVLNSLMQRVIFRAALRSDHQRKLIEKILKRRLKLNRELGRV